MSNLRSPIRALVLVVALAGTLSGCLKNDVQRVMVGAAAGAVVADMAGGDMLGGAIIGGVGCGLACR